MRASSLCVAFVLLSCSSNDAGTTDVQPEGETGGSATPDAGSGGRANATGGGGVAGGLLDAGKGTGGKAGTGGATGTGGGTGSGGGAGTGGATGTGGTGGTGGVTGTGGATGTGGSAGGTVWYDGEPSGLPLSAGNAGLSSGSTATEITSGCHAGSACMSVNLIGSGGWSHLGWDPSHNSIAFDLSADTTLEFWIKGNSTGIQMEMHGASGGCAWITLNDYLSGGATATWQKVSIPLSAFQMDRTTIHTVDFWLSTGTAAFVIDDGRWL
jgi:hypothetical protein